MHGSAVQSFSSVMIDSCAEVLKIAASAARGAAPSNVLAARLSGDFG
jgi:hypothetical protein